MRCISKLSKLFTTVKFVFLIDIVLGKVNLSSSRTGRHAPSQRIAILNDFVSPLLLVSFVYVGILDDGEFTMIF